MPKTSINYQLFSQLDLRVAKIIEVSPLADSQKLYLIKVKLGDEERQLVAGLQPYYSAEELLGKEVIIVANLEPKKIFGHLSQGMLLAADDGQGTVSLLTVDKKIKLGSKVR